ncbi:MAG: right-handed parallel beta-helix repeat-containing protein [Desulfobacterales bacterium]|nr:right-handed parallel beta-helix repeat-containing protein [Desulfobacterales bacterium]
MQKKIRRILKGAFILLTLFFFYLQAAYALDINGIINTDARWTTADSPIHITGDVRVETDTTLTIDPGVAVVFQSPADITQGFSIRIDGELIARGTRSQPIIFTAADRTVPWGSIMFSDESKDWDQTASAGSIIEYCIIEYGGNQPDGRAMISAFNAMPMISKNAIRFGDAAGISALVSEDPAVIASLSGNVRVMSNLIYNNTTGIRFSAEGGIIKNNYFLNNGRAMNLQVRSRDVDVTNNTVVSSASELFGTGIRLVLDEAANGIAAYEWRQTGGPTVTLNNPQSARTSFMAPDPGNGIETLSFELTVTDKDGNQATDTSEIRILGDNQPPAARAGTDLNVQLPQVEGEEITVTLSAEGSSDPYLGIAEYAWEQIEGTPVELEDADTINPSFTVPASVSAGDRMAFRLTVEDQGGLTATDTVEVVYFDDNIFPVAEAGEDRTVSQGTRVILDATGSRDPDGSISAYRWEQTDGTPVALVNPTTARPYFDAPRDNTSPETLTFQLRVTDNEGLNDTDPVSITVNSPLIADIGATVSGENRVTLDASGSVDQDAAAQIHIEANTLKMDNPDAGLLAISAAENASFDLDITRNNLTAHEDEGYLVYTYSWSDKAPQTLRLPNNWWGTDDALIIEDLIYDQINSYELPTVEFRPFTGQAIPGTGSPLPYPPLAEAGPDLETAADHAVTLDGSSSYDPDGIARYHWQQTDGPSVNLRNADQPTATFVAPSGGEAGTELGFRLTVSTGEAFSHTDSTNVTVSPDERHHHVDSDTCFIRSAGSDSPGGPGGTAFLALLIGALAALIGIILKGASRRLRRILFTACILMAACFIATPPAHAGYFSIGGGAGGDADDANATIETGAKDIRFKNLDLLFGMGMHFIPHSDDELPGSTIDASCPNEACIGLSDERKGTEVGLYGKLGVEIKSSDFYVTAIGGFTTYTESELSRSPATGRVYEDGTDNKIDGLIGGGVSYFIDYKIDFVLQVDIDNIRGVTGTIGWHW